MGFRNINLNSMDGGAMSLIKREGSSHWWIDITVSGKRVRESTGTEDRAKAKEFEKARQDQLWRQNKLGDKASILWSVVTKKYLADSDKERSRDVAILNWFAKYLDKQPVGAITSGAIEKLRDLIIADGMSKSTCNRFMNTLKAVLRKCVEWEYLPSVPRIPMFKLKAFEPRWLTPSQYQDLRAKLPYHLQLAADFAVLTGLRMREQSQLTWDRVNLEKNHAWIPASQMKGDKARHIHLNPQAVETLQALRELNPEGEAVFQWKGQRIDNFHTKAFRDAVKESGVDPFRWHDLRHTFASWAVQNGVGLQQLMELGAWKSYSMVLRYAHLDASHLATESAKVGTFWTQSEKNSSVPA